MIRDDVAEKRITILCQCAPYGSSAARESLDVCLAASVYVAKLQVIFTGDGVWQLVRGQDTRGGTEKQHDKLLASFPLYDIEAVFADRDSLSERGLEESMLVEGITIIDRNQLTHELSNADQVLSL